MILIIGGIASGKKTYVREVLGYADTDFDTDPFGTAPVIYDVQECVRAGCDVQRLLASLLCKEVVIINEVGSGVIPAEKDDRRFREACGRMTNRLAQSAETVVRLCCGIPTVLKSAENQTI